MQPCKLLVLVLLGGRTGPTQMVVVSVDFMKSKPIAYRYFDEDFDEIFDNEIVPSKCSPPQCGVIDYT